MEEVKRYDCMALGGFDEGGPVKECVLYADYAALKARVAVVEQNRDLWVQTAQRHKEHLEAIQLQRDNVVRERDTLRAQLEEAREHLAIQHVALTQNQLTAQPDGVRTQVMDALVSAHRFIGGGADRDDSALADKLYYAIQALAAPAPAKVCRHGCVDGWIWKGEWDTDGHGNIQPINHPCPDCSGEGRL